MEVPIDGRDFYVESARIENLLAASGPILASGMAEYSPETDSLVSEIFDRADREMYGEKRALKAEEKRLRE